MLSATSRNFFLITLLALAGCGTGLPSCDSADAKAMTRNVLKKEFAVGEGDTCVVKNEGLGFLALYPPNQGACRGGILVHDMTYELTDYLVESEEAASDGRSMNCSISTKYRLRSQSGGIDKVDGPTRFTLRYYRTTDNGERRYEYQIQKK